MWHIVKHLSALAAILAVSACSAGLAAQSLEAQAVVGNPKQCASSLKPLQQAETLQAPSLP